MTQSKYKGWCIVPLTLLFIFLPLAGISQVDTTAIAEDNFYVGVGFSTVSFHIYYKKPEVSKHVKSGFFAPLSFYMGYKLSKRTLVQAGIAYGGSRDRFSWSSSPHDTLSINAKSTTHVLAVPITVKHIFFKAYKRLPVYGTATLMPAFGITNGSLTETRHQVTTMQTAKDTGVNTFFTAGLGLEYKISKRLNGYVEYHAFKHNLTGQNSYFFDWDMGAQGLFRFVRTVGLGVNYSI